ncbi:MAG: hypothetical protein A2268_05685 [Candidatus Raymondbacteria bacterium RifOxyA12_full_50_37]|uniref:HTH gntR-type domain-containing protein n=1 Tax=Candidatus Raymondbacteria bacterium RIFOXYD12_FULL_49_13 TaxID=1817890 RepID=A0A1F7FJD7_UNCRA|nr:MAG: hypothetical protein A2268_05685 [Candidatus Raymondbacteria bacterium RifOxyA12_full_50_37]OGJ88885.1 MAG: hypothetical protein A2350_10230 [Candidatus Raymondbacteria bacterium RifOxyB12_full_50_8]OGJ89055.1 MAG: hypothetical protein A2248_02920 [Candidatus Raymondbacteria bacterium RIFOXYA2_FULL_49_16]OGJ93345.1 MAG: hypothetical protein A2487_04185 [Candidatus Raymondbacteria bacterium RifOxyC12_full_50_8]OGJ97082.1 MAG: hypothetical protein A2453_04335 [Candidatus Raymondbacteria b
MVQSIIKSNQLISDQLCERFKKDIEKGRYKPNTPLPSFGTLAEHYGISKSTVHEAFKILAEEGYLYPKQGKGTFINPEKVITPQGGKLTSVAVIAFNVFSASDNSMVPLMEAMNTQTSRMGTGLHVHYINGMSVQQEENSVVRDAIAENRYQGLIIVSPLDVGDIEWFGSLRLPFVAATARYHLNIPQVSLDNAHAATLATQLFCEHNATRIAAFIGPVSWERQGITPYARELADAFANESHNHGLSIELVPCEYSIENAKAKALELLSKGVRFDGYFFQADVIARGALAAFKEMNIDPASAICVNYCDRDDHLVQYNVRKPLYDIGDKAFALLEALHSGQEVDHKHIVVQPFIA